MTTPDLVLLAEWNAGVERARRAYRADPQALSRHLALTGEDTCGVCQARKHSRCTGRMGQGGRHPCLCEHVSHYPNGASA